MEAMNYHCLREIYLIIYQKGYQTEIIYDTEIKPDTTFTLPTVNLIELDKIGKGSINGKLIDGVSGEAVTNAKMIIRSGFHHSNGEILMATYTDENGEYEVLNLLSGLYSIEVIKDGYISYLFNTHIQKVPISIIQMKVSPLTRTRKD